MRRAALAVGWLLMQTPSIAARAEPAPASVGSPSAVPVEAGAEKSAANKESAKTRFAKGMEYAGTGRWSQALAEFQASFELYPAPAALINVAMSWQRLGNAVEALAVYEQVESKFGDRLSTEQRRTVEQAKTELATRVGELSLVSNIDGASIEVDGRRLAATPLTSALRLAVGEHEVRVKKPAYETFQLKLSIASQQRTTTFARLNPSREEGALAVRESQDRQLQVVVDGTAIGVTPLESAVPAGQHSLALRGADDLGALPVAVNVKPGVVTKITLQAVKFDASLRVQAIPATARLEIDRALVATGSFEGHLPSGTHWIEAQAPGYAPLRRQVTLVAGTQTQPLALTLRLEPARHQAPFGLPGTPFVEAGLGLSLASSLAGGADASCGRDVTFADGSSGPACRARSRPLGAWVQARVGYRLSSGLGLDVLLAYLGLHEMMTRRMEVLTADGSSRIKTTDLVDQTHLSAALFGIGASFRALERTPLLARVSAGLAITHLRSGVEGHFGGLIPVDADSVADYSGQLRLGEDPKNVLAPFIAPEVRAGYRVSPHLTVDLGFSLMVLLAPSRLRSGGRDGTSDLRKYWMPRQALSDGGSVTPGRITLPKESALGTIVAWLPSLGARWEF